MFSAKDIATLIVSPEQVETFSLTDWNELVFILRKEKMLARFYDILERAQLATFVPPEASRHFTNARIVSRKQTELAKKEAAELSKALGNMCEFVVFLKGVAYSVTDNEASLGRVYSDIDLLVPKNTLVNVEQYLAVVGWKRKELEDYDEMYYRKWAHEIPPMQHGSRGTVLDIHHNFVPIVSGRGIDTRAFVEEYRVTHDGVSVLTEPAMFFHSAIHLLFNEDMSSAFRDMTDLYLLSHSQPQEFYLDVLEITEKHGFKKECILAFHLLSIHFNIKFPLSVETSVNEELKNISICELKLLKRLTLPKHRLLADGELLFNQWLGEIRGHWMKMPLFVLTYHITIKSCRTIIQSIFGKHVFLKSDRDRL